MPVKVKGVASNSIILNIRKISLFDNRLDADCYQLPRKQKETNHTGQDPKHKGSNLQNMQTSGVLCCSLVN